MGLYCWWVFLFLSQQYRIGQLYTISKHSHEESDKGEGVEVVRNEPHIDPVHGEGQFTEKRVHLSRVWGLISHMLEHLRECGQHSKSAINSIRLAVSNRQCSFLPKFSIHIETKYEDNCGDNENKVWAPLRPSIMDFTELIAMIMKNTAAQEEQTKKMEEQTRRLERQTQELLRQREEEPPLPEPRGEEPPLPEPRGEEPPLPEPRGEEPPLPEPRGEEPPLPEPRGEEPPLPEPRGEEPPLPEPRGEEPPLPEPRGEEPPLPEPRGEEPPLPEPRGEEPPLPEPRGEEPPLPEPRGEEPPLPEPRGEEPPLPEPRGEEPPLPEPRGEEPPLPEPRGEEPPLPEPRGEEPPLPEPRGEEPPLPEPRGEEPPLPEPRGEEPPLPEPRGEEPPLPEPRGEEPPLPEPRGEEPPLPEPRGEEPPLPEPRGEEPPLPEPRGEEPPLPEPRGEEPPLPEPRGEEPPLPEPRGEEPPLPEPRGEEPPNKNNSEREVCFLDIAYDDIPDRHYKSSEDLRCFASIKTGRGPLKEGWREKDKPVMCSYKLVSVKFEVWGLQTRVEQFVHKVMRDILLIGHRQAFAWVDEWYNMTMDEVRKYERDTQKATNEKIGPVAPTICVSEVSKPSTSRSAPSSAPSTPINGDPPDFLNVPKDRQRKKSAPEMLTLPELRERSHPK
ncbi:UNVERIFIED_CONTAM: hypothetical protein FKN15_066363 [Acipenser sinensis]